MGLCCSDKSWVIGKVWPLPQDNLKHWRNKMFNKQKARILIISLLLVASATAYPEARQRSVYLGSASVDGNFDRDTIRVGRSAGPFRAVQLSVNGGSVRIHRLVVRYGDGTREELMIRSIIPSGGSTRPLRLSGYRRSLRSIDLWYGKAQWRTRPVVSLHGLR